ncbi:hypothetical protein Vretimale_4488 [Volvox reticuliferus]|uniref:Uncharacterized protein n=1 Tax=Volvox reticuliferus TaxID=1737510 RepID=A0A8J4DGM5_9CHLO|nr:hypothetical protein Vretimale_4488 [Volvox reticuliferus]
MAQKRQAIREALVGLHYGPTCMVYSMRCQSWYCAHIVNVNGDILKIRYRGWEEDEEIHKFSDRLDCSTGGRKKWKGIKGARGAFRRVWPEWTPAGAQLDPAVMISLAAESARKGKDGARRRSQEQQLQGRPGTRKTSQAAPSGPGDLPSLPPGKLPGDGIDGRGGHDGGDDDEDGYGPAAGSGAGASGGRAVLRPTKRRRTLGLEIPHSTRSESGALQDGSRDAWGRGCRGQSEGGPCKQRQQRVLHRTRCQSMSEEETEETEEEHSGDEDGEGDETEGGVGEEGNQEEEQDTHEYEEQLCGQAVDEENRSGQQRTVTRRRYSTQPGRDPCRMQDGGGNGGSIISGEGGGENDDASSSDDRSDTENYPKGDRPEALGAVRWGRAADRFQNGGGHHAVSGDREHERRRTIGLTLRADTEPKPEPDANPDSDPKEDSDTSPGWIRGRTRGHPRGRPRGSGGGRSRGRRGNTCLQAAVKAAPAQDIDAADVECHQQRLDKGRWRQPSSLGCEELSIGRAVSQPFVQQQGQEQNGRGDSSGRGLVGQQCAGPHCSTAGAQLADCQRAMVRMHYRDVADGNACGGTTVTIGGHKPVARSRMGHCNDGSSGLADGSLRLEVASDQRASWSASARAKFGVVGEGAEHAPAPGVVSITTTGLPAPVAAGVFRAVPVPISKRPKRSGGTGGSHDSQPQSKQQQESQSQPLQEHPVEQQLSQPPRHENREKHEPQVTMVLDAAVNAYVRDPLVLGSQALGSDVQHPTRQDDDGVVLAAGETAPEMPAPGHSTEDLTAPRPHGHQGAAQAQAVALEKPASNLEDSQPGGSSNRVPSKGVPADPPKRGMAELRAAACWPGAVLSVSEGPGPASDPLPGGAHSNDGGVIVCGDKCSEGPRVDGEALDGGNSVLTCKAAPMARRPVELEIRAIHANLVSGAGNTAKSTECQLLATPGRTEDLAIGPEVRAAEAEAADSAAQEPIEMEGLQLAGLAGLGLSTLVEKQPAEHGQESVQHLAANLDSFELQGWPLAMWGAIDSAGAADLQDLPHRTAEGHHPLVPLAVVGAAAVAEAAAVAARATARAAGTPAGQLHSARGAGDSTSRKEVDGASRDGATDHYDSAAMGDAHEHESLLCMTVPPPLLLPLPLHQDVHSESGLLDVVPLRSHPDASGEPHPDLALEEHAGNAVARGLNAADLLPLSSGVRPTRICADDAVREQVEAGNAAAVETSAVDDVAAAGIPAAPLHLPEALEVPAHDMLVDAVAAIGSTGEMEAAGGVAQGLSASELGTGPAGADRAAVLNIPRPQGKDAEQQDAVTHAAVTRAASSLQAFTTNSSRPHGGSLAQAAGRRGPITLASDVENPLSIGAGGCVHAGPNVTGTAAAAAAAEAPEGGTCHLEGEPVQAFGRLARLAAAVREAAAGMGARGSVLAAAAAEALGLRHEPDPERTLKCPQFGATSMTYRKHVAWDERQGIGAAPSIPGVKMQDGGLPLASELIQDAHGALPELRSRAQALQPSVPQPAQTQLPLQGPSMEGAAEAALRLAPEVATGTGPSAPHSAFTARQSHGDRRKSSRPQRQRPLEHLAVRGGGLATAVTRFNAGSLLCVAPVSVETQQDQDPHFGKRKEHSTEETRSRPQRKPKVTGYTAGRSLSDRDQRQVLRDTDGDRLQSLLPPPPQEAAPEADGGPGDDKADAGTSSAYVEIGAARDDAVGAKGAAGRGASPRSARSKGATGNTPSSDAPVGRRAAGRNPAVTYASPCGTSPRGAHGTAAATAPTSNPGTIGRTIAARTTEMLEEGVAAREACADHQRAADTTTMRRPRRRVAERSAPREEATLATEVRTLRSLLAAHQRRVRNLERQLQAEKKVNAQVESKCKALEAANQKQQQEQRQRRRQVAAADDALLHAVAEKLLSYATRLQHHCLAASETAAKVMERLECFPHAASLEETAGVCMAASGASGGAAPQHTRPTAAAASAVASIRLDRLEQQFARLHDPYEDVQNALLRIRRADPDLWERLQPYLPAHIREDHMCTSNSRAKALVEDFNALSSREKAADMLSEQLNSLAAMVEQRAAVLMAPSKAAILAVMPHVDREPSAVLRLLRQLPVMLPEEAILVIPKDKVPPEVLNVASPVPLPGPMLRRLGQADAQQRPSQQRQQVPQLAPAQPQSRAAQQRIRAGQLEQKGQAEAQDPALHDDDDDQQQQRQRQQQQELNAKPQPHPVAQQQQHLHRHQQQQARRVVPEQPAPQSSPQQMLQQLQQRANEQCTQRQQHQQRQREGLLAWDAQQKQQQLRPPGPSLPANAMVTDNLMTASCRARPAVAETAQATGGASLGCRSRRDEDLQRAPPAMGSRHESPDDPGLTAQTAKRPRAISREDSGMQVQSLGGSSPERQAPPHLAWNHRPQWLQASALKELPPPGSGGGGHVSVASVELGSLPSRRHHDEVLHQQQQQGLHRVPRPASPRPQPLPQGRYFLERQTIMVPLPLHVQVEPFGEARLELELGPGAGPGVQDVPRPVRPPAQGVHLVVAPAPDVGMSAGVTTVQAVSSLVANQSRVRVVQRDGIAGAVANGPARDLDLQPARLQGQPQQQHRLQHQPTVTYVRGPAVRVPGAHGIPRRTESPLHGDRGGANGGHGSGGNVGGGSAAGVCNVDATGGPLAAQLLQQLAVEAMRSGSPACGDSIMLMPAQAQSLGHLRGQVGGRFTSVGLKVPAASLLAQQVAARLGGAPLKPIYHDV